MKLEEIVTGQTGTLPKKKAAELPASQILETTPELSELLAEGRGAEKLLCGASKKRAWEIAVPLAARFAAADRSAEVGCGAEIFAALADLQSGRATRETLLRTVQRACNRLELAMLIGDKDGMLSFLEYIWGDEFEEKLARFTDSETKTVREWAGGREPARYNTEIMLGATVVLFQLHRECGMSRVATARYFEEVRFANSEDLRLKHHALWGWISEYIACNIFWHGREIPFPNDVSSHVVSLGGDSEVFFPDFRRRFLG